MAKYKNLLDEFHKTLIRAVAVRLKNKTIGHDCNIVRDRGNIAYIKFSGDNRQSTKLEEWESVLEEDLRRLNELEFLRLEEQDAHGWPIRYTLNERLIVTVFDADFDISEDWENSIEIERLKQELSQMTSQIDRAVSIPNEIQASFAKFQKDHPDPSKAAFIMMSFGNSIGHAQIVDAIRKTLHKFDITGLRADGKEYHPDLYQNMLTYIYGCQFGIAVFEHIEKEIFNPNVALEVGYMFGIGKEVCLLKDQTIGVLPADLIGKLYKEFDPSQVAKTLPNVLTRWLSDRGFSLAEEKYKKLAKLRETLNTVAMQYNIFILDGTLTRKVDPEKHEEIIRKAQDICEAASVYDSLCPPQCLTVHTEADADPTEFRSVNKQCQHQLLYIALKRLTPYQPTKKDNPLEAKVWGEYRSRNQKALQDAQARISELMENLNTGN